MKFKLGDERIDIECTWGDGPDVLMNIHRSKEHVQYWKAGFVPLDLTADQAIRMGHNLIDRGLRALELEQIAQEYMEKEDNTDVNGRTKTGSNG